MKLYPFDSFRHELQERLKDPNCLKKGKTHHPELGIVAKKWHDIILGALEKSLSYHEFSLRIREDGEKNIGKHRKKTNYGTLFRLVRHHLAHKHKHDVALYTRYKDIFEHQPAHAIEAIFLEGLLVQFPRYMFARAPHFLENGVHNLGTDWLATLNKKHGRCAIQFSLNRTEEKRCEKLTTLLPLLRELSLGKNGNILFDTEGKPVLRSPDMPSEMGLLSIHGLFAEISSAKNDSGIWRDTFAAWEKGKFSGPILDAYAGRKIPKKDITQEYDTILQGLRDIFSHLDEQNMKASGEKYRIVISHRQLNDFVAKEYSVLDLKGKKLCTFTYFPKNNIYRCRDRKFW